MPAPAADFSIRPATESDLPLILTFIKDLAAYEKLSHEVEATESGLRSVLFGAHPVAEVILAEAGREAVGFAVFFANYSTWEARPGLYLEDLFVRPAARGKGIGRALLEYLARLTIERGWARLEWRVLDWNTPSIEFYKAAGAQPMDEWTVFRLTDEALTTFAEDRRDR